MERVQLVGKKLRGKEKYMLNKIVNIYYDKIARVVKNPFTLRVAIKGYQTAGKGKKNEKVEGKQRKVSIKAVVITATKNLETHASDWDLNRTTHAALKNMLAEIEHKFRPSEQGRK